MLATLKKTNTKFAVGITGHHPTAEFSSVDESGVVIDLRDIKSLALDEDGDGSFTLRAGGGSTWGDVYTFLKERGRSIVGARNFRVGLGGFTLGGACQLVSRLFLSLHRSSTVLGGLQLNQCPTRRHFGFP